MMVSRSTMLVEEGGTTRLMEKLTRRMHDAADNKAADRTAGKMQRRALLHSDVLNQLPLG